MKHSSKPYIKYGDGYILLQDVVLPELPETLEMNGVTLQRKHEFHISLANVKRLATFIDASRVAQLTQELTEEFTAYVTEHSMLDYTLTNDFYFAQKDTRKTVVVLAKVPALRGFFEHIRKKYGRKDIPMLPTHVTIYSLDPNVGIGILSPAELKELGTKVKLPIKVAPRILNRTKFGHPLLRQKAKRLTKEEILSPEIQDLIASMRHTVVNRPYGVGLAAQQVGKDAALSLIAIKSTPTRPNRQPFESVIINPEIVETFGRRTGLWEGCISCGQGIDTLYAKVPRYKKVKLRWLDQNANEHEEILEGLPAHVAQHEVDHTNGVLFVDRVKDTTTYMMADEYRKRVVQKKR